MLSGCSRLAGIVAGGRTDLRDEHEAAAALSTVESEYTEHAAAARELAEEHLDAEKVLTDLLETCGLDA